MYGTNVMIRQRIWDALSLIAVCLVIGPMAVTIPICLACYKPSDGKYSCPKVMDVVTKYAKYAWLILYCVLVVDKTINKCMLCPK